MTQYDMKTFLKTSVTLISLAASVCFAESSIPLAKEELIEKATQATVLIKTHLKYGFLDDKIASGRWSGSGFLIDRTKGWIMTNAHVAGYGHATLRLKFEDQKQFINASRVFLDTKHDVAILSIDPESIPSEAQELTLGCDYTLTRGSSVVSLGHPEGQDFTASFGVLSGEKDFHVQGSFYTTDLVTESGSSGGPVLSLNTGNVVGMSTAGFDDSDLGFLTKPRNMCSIFNRLKDGSNPARPRASFQTMIVDKEYSPLVGAVFDTALGIRTGDEILSWNGNLWSPEQHGDLLEAMRGYTEKSVQLSVIRDGGEVIIDVPVRAGQSAHNKEWVYFTGLTISEDSKSDVRYLLGNINTPPLSIETIDTDFDDTEDIEFYRGVDILSIGDVAGMDLKALYQLLSEWPKIKVVGRVFEQTPESYTHWMKHSFDIKDLDCSWCKKSDAK